MDAGIDCEFSYFSDDFYFFCNEKDNDKIIEIFDTAIEEHDLERSDKKAIWTYESFNNHNLVARYWKSLLHIAIYGLTRTRITINSILSIKWFIACPS